MLSTAFGEIPNAVGTLLFPDQPLLVMYEYWMPQRNPPFGPL
jgi:hypothetical protein